MKRKLLLFLMLTIYVSTVSAIDYGEKIYPLDSHLYESIEKLYLIEGHSLPSTAKPYSGSEVKDMLNIIKPSSKVSRKLYDKILNEVTLPAKIILDDNDVAMNFDTTIALETYIHTNEVFKDEEYWIYGFNEREKNLDIEWDLWSTDNIYVYFDAPLLMNSLGNHHNDVSGNYLYQNIITTNSPLLPPADLGADGDFTFPYRSFMSVGDNHWNLSSGRDRFSWGPGESGNFVLGDHFIQHDFIKFTTFHNSYKYTLLSSFFPPDSTMGVDQNWEPTGFKMFLGHRIEFSLLEDKIGLALSESVMYKTDYNTLNLAAINPFGFFHNEYIRGMANSLISVEVDYNPFGYLDFYGQFAIDEISLGETMQPDPGSYPNAFALMLGAKAAFPIKDDYIVKTSLETAFTDPFLYLRGLDGTADGSAAGYSHGYGFDAIVKNFNKPGDYKRMYLGYEYGGDAVVVNFTSSFENIDNYNVYFNAMYMLHGNKRLDSGWSAYGKNGLDELVTILSGDVIERTLILSLGGKYEFKKLNGLFAKANLDYINIVNMKSDTATTITADDYGDTYDEYLNIEDNNHSDFQLSLTLGYSF
ncbi:MAG: hypothetical protein ACPKM0_05505 [Pleomorphochaeta sp.]